MLYTFRAAARIVAYGLMPFAKRFLTVLIVVLALPLWVTSTIAAESCGPAFNGARSGGNRGFVIYDGLNYLGMPDLSAYGMVRIKIVDRGIWAIGHDGGAPDKHAVRDVARSVPLDSTPVVLDFESYDLEGPEDEINASITALMQITAEFREALPHRKLGFYGAPPLRDYWRSLKSDRPDSKFRAWQQQNDRLSRLTENVDVLFPSIYTFYDDPAGWKRYAIAQVCEARRLSNKPVIAFIWPEYHPSRKLIWDRFIDADFWQMQLDLLRRYADGIVVWGGYDIQNRHRRQWDNSAAWWLRTKAFALSVSNTPQ